MIRLIIFDWDDVITLGSTEGYYACYREALESLGVAIPEDEMQRRIKRRWGQPYPEVFRELLAERPELQGAACDRFSRHFWGDTFVGKLREVRGANESLLALSARFTLAVASGNHPDMIRKKIIPAFGIPDVFRGMITSFDVPVEKTKPDPHMLVKLMENLGFSPDETVYVGDAENDVRMAHASGAAPVVVLTGHLDKRQAEALGVTRIIPDMTHLMRILES